MTCFLGAWGGGQDHVLTSWALQPILLPDDHGFCPRRRPGHDHHRTRFDRYPNRPDDPALPCQQRSSGGGGRPGCLDGLRSRCASLDDAKCPGGVRGTSGRIGSAPGGVSGTSRGVGRTSRGVGRTPGGVGRTPSGIGSTPGGVRRSSSGVGATCSVGATPGRRYYSRSVPTPLACWVVAGLFDKGKPPVLTCIYFAAAANQPAAAAPAPSALESVVNLGGIGGGAAAPAQSTPAAAAANNPAAAVSTPAVGQAAANAPAQNAAQPNIDTSGLALASEISLGNLAAQTAAVI